VADVQQAVAATAAPEAHLRIITEAVAAAALEAIEETAAVQAQEMAE
jgi:hypothetical protein